MNTNTDAGAARIMTDALASTRPATLLLQAAVATAPKASYKVPRPKLNRDEVHAVMRVVTEQLRRFDLKPTVALLPPGRLAHAAGGTYKLFLTEKEMVSGAFTRPDKDIVRRVGNHVESVRRIAKHAGVVGHQVDLLDLVDELAAPLDDFLAQFAPEDVDPDAELADDISLVARWLGSPRRDFELTRFMSEASRQSLLFNPEKDAMSFDAHGGDISGHNMPTIPLFLRVVGRVPVEVHEVHDDADSGIQCEDRDEDVDPQSTVVGSATCYLCYQVGLSAIPDRRGLRMAFRLTPLSYVSNGTGRRFGSAFSEIPHFHILDGGLISADERHFKLSGNVEMLCPLFQRHFSDAYEDATLCRTDLQLHQQYEDATPHTIALIFQRPEPQTQSPFNLFRESGTHQHLVSFGRVVEATALPREVMSEGGIRSEHLRERFEAALYLPETDPGSLAAQITEEASRRCAALDEYEVQAADGKRRRKLSFRSAMRK